MSKLYYVIVVMGIFFIIIGIITSIIMEDCYNKTFTDFYSSEVCRKVFNYKK